MITENSGNEHMVWEQLINTNRAADKSLVCLSFLSLNEKRLTGDEKKSAGGSININIII